MGTPPTQTKSKQRIADHGEVFTNEREVKAMLDLVKAQSHNLANTFLEPACGNGNFLAEILKRKLATALTQSKINKSQKSPKYCKDTYERLAVQAVSSIYGIELLADNCAECRERLFNLFLDHYQKYINKPNEQMLAVIKFLLNNNIINGDALTLKDNKGNPIVFSEWKFMGVQLLRKEFVYEYLVKKDIAHSRNDSQFIAKALKEYQPIHFLSIEQARPIRTDDDPRQ